MSENKPEVVTMDLNDLLGGLGGLDYVVVNKEEKEPPKETKDK